MEEIGVEAIVKGLSSFLGDMGKIDSSINKLLPGTDLLSNAFGWLGDVISGFAGGALRVLEYTLGNLIADAIEAVISKIKELISSVIEAGNEFQTLSIRLNGLNLQDAIDSGLDYTDAMNQAVEVTREQMEWLQTLGAATPFDPAAIANVYALARSYGFADDEARRLTKDTLEFSAGMGLTSAHLERVVQNLGQMVQRGKITSTEIRDLARGAFLPVNDVLERIVKNSDGAFATIADLQKAISKPGGGVPAEQFIEAFEQMVEEEPRFVGAAGRLGRAFIPASENVKELATSIFGLNVVKPVLDVLGERIAGMVDLFVSFNEQGDLIKTKRWDALVAAATKLGEAISSVVSEVFGLIPSTESLVDAVIAGVNGLAQLITENKEGIVGFFQNIGTVISEQIIPFIGKVAQGFIMWLGGSGGSVGLRGFLQVLEGIWSAIMNQIVPVVLNTLIPAWNTFSEWVNDNRHLINGFFSSLGDIFGKLVAQLTNQAVSSEGGLLGAIEAFMRFVTQNEDLIVRLISAFIHLSIAVMEFKLAVAAMAYSVTAAFTLLWAGLKAALEGAYNTIVSWVNGIKSFLGIHSPSTMFINIGMSIAQGLVQGIQQSLGNAYSVGRNMIESVARGVRNAAGILIDAARNAAINAYNSVLSALGMHSPSTLFVAIGENTMESMALGVQNMVSKAAATMQAATLQVSAAAMGATNNVTNNTNNNSYNLTVNSGAQTEPIIQDYNMLQSLAGA